MSWASAGWFFDSGDVLGRRRDEPKDPNPGFSFSAPPAVMSDGPRGPEAMAAKRFVSALNTITFDPAIFAHAIVEQGGIIQMRVFEVFHGLVHIYASWYEQDRIPKHSPFYEIGGICWRFIQFMKEIENPVDLDDDLTDTREDDTL